MSGGHERAGRVRSAPADPAASPRPEAAHPMSRGHGHARVWLVSGRRGERGALRRRSAVVCVARAPASCTPRRDLLRRLPCCAPVPRGSRCPPWRRLCYSAIICRGARAAALRRAGVECSTQRCWSVLHPHELDVHEDCLVDHAPVRAAGGEKVSPAPPPDGRVYGRSLAKEKAMKLCMPAGAAGWGSGLAASSPLPQTKRTPVGEHKIERALALRRRGGGLCVCVCVWQRRVSGASKRRPLFFGAQQTG